MILILILFFLFITVIGYVLNKSLFGPLFVFGITWTLTLIILGLNYDSFYSIDLETYLVIALGGLGFLIGTIFANTISYRPNKNFIVIKRSSVITLLLILVIGWFEYHRQILSLTAGTGLFNSFQEARYALVQASLSGEKLLGPIANLEVISYIAVAICANEIKKIKWGGLIFSLALLIGFAYVTLGGAKGGVLTLIITSYIIYYFHKDNRSIIKIGCIVFLAVTFLFSVGLYVVNFAYDNLGDIENTIFSISIAIRNYWVGGLVAFDQVIQNPAGFVPSQDPTRFFIETANSFGAKITLPPVHADYVNISNTENTNVYTIFYSYYLFGGALGVFMFMVLYSFIMTAIFKISKYGDGRVLIIYALLLNGLIFSIVSERFLLSLNGTIKSIIFVWLFYFLGGYRINRLPISGQALPKISKR